MRIGYACLALAVPGTELKSCILKNASPERLRALIHENLQALERMVAYTIENGSRMYRISSDIIPFASSPVNTVPWAEEFASRLEAIGRQIREGGVRVSMHPGQYTVLNSPHEATVQSSVLELAYHARFLDALGVDAGSKIILHVGGAYGDKPAAMERFAAQYAMLAPAIKRRLVLENDDRIYTIAEVLDLSARLGIPAVFDNLHHAANPSPDKRSDAEWIAACARTWREQDGMPKIHYSQADPSKKLGAHSQSINVDAFASFVDALPAPKPDIMLEVKDKNISALKCMLCMADKGPIGALEREWGRNKYRVLEHSQRHYQQIRALLKDKKAFPARAFYQLVEDALAQPILPGSAANAAEHVWGYFKETASPAQNNAFHARLKQYLAGQATLLQVKKPLQALAKAQGQAYLLESYYFLP